MKWFYLICSIVGTIIVYIPMGLHSALFGFTLNGLIEAMFANYLTTFISLDLLITCLVFWGFMVHEMRSYPIPKWWVALLANFLVGLCLALPLFLFFRECAREKAMTESFNTLEETDSF